VQRKYLNLFGILSMLFINFVFAGSSVLAQKNNVHSQQEIEENKFVYQAFLRKTTVILDVYQQSVNISFRYKRNSVDNLYGSCIHREFGIITSYHLGLPKNVEVYLIVPTFWKNRVIRDLIEVEETECSNVGVGDLLVGTKFIIFQQEKSILDIIGSLEVNMPTGDHPYFKESEELGLGSGHWSVSTGLSVIKSCDPAVIYGGVTYTYAFEEIYDENRIQPGRIIGYNLGMAFLINDKLTVNGNLIGNYQTEAKINSEKIPFSSVEPIMLRTSIMYALRKNAFIEPSIVFGLNDDTSDSSVGLSYGRRF